MNWEQIRLGKDAEKAIIFCIKKMFVYLIAIFYINNLRSVSDNGIFFNIFLISN
jgi:hypothetical protein